MPSSVESGFSRHGQLQETIPTTVNKTGLWRFLTPVFRERYAPCRLACPLESGIPLWMNKARQGDWQGAWQVMQAYNPFPAITGHVCYRFCEEKCHRSLWDEPLAVREVEKAIGLWRQENYRPDSKGTPGPGGRGQKNKKVAIVGSGPAGLSCAYYLQLQGVAVTIFEKLPLAGGLLATGIPEYRLPRSILNKELEILEAEGVVFKTGREVGREIGLAALQENFDAVLLAVGAQQNRPLQIRGEELPGVTGALNFLRDIHLGRQKEVAAKRVVVVGGGNAAVDAATMAKLQGARGVSLLYRRSREEMPAHPEEVEAAAKAGVQFVFQTVLQEICGARCVEMVRTRRVAPSRRGEELQLLPGTAHELPCDLLVVAAGQESGLPELASSLQVMPVLEEGGVELPAGDRLSEDNIVLLAGDALTGPASVAAAIFSGRKAALMLLRALGLYPEPEDIPGIVFPLQGEVEALPYEHLNPILYPRQGRVATASAQEEAERCFSCGTCSSCGVCWVFCPEPAIEENNGTFHVLLDYCKGCGICVTECPAGVLALEEVPWHGA